MCAAPPRSFDVIFCLPEGYRALEAVVDENRQHFRAFRIMDTPDYAPELAIYVEAPAEWIAWLRHEGKRISPAVRALNACLKERLFLDLNTASILHSAGELYGAYR